MVEMADTSLESLPGKVLEEKPDVNALTTSIGSLGLEKLMLPNRFTVEVCSIQSGN